MKDRAAKFVCLISTLAIMAMIVVCALPVSAAGGSGGGSSEGGTTEEPTGDVVLTPEQTVALYGSTITGTYYDELNHTYHNLTFQYAYPLKSIGYMDTGGGFSGLSDSISPASVLSFCKSMNGCVYVASSSQWGGGTFPTYQNRDSGGDPCNLTLNFSLSIPCTRFTQAVMWSTGKYNCKSDSYESSIRWKRADTFWQCHLANSELAPNGNATYGGSASTSSVPAHPIMPFYPYYASGAALDESQTPEWGVFYEDVTIGSMMVISGFDYGMQSLQQTIKYSNSSPPSGDVAIIIGCPAISQYEPNAVVTTAPRVTTAPSVTTTRKVTGTAAPAYTYVTQEPLDLSNIESGIAQIIQQEYEQNQKLDWIGNNAEAAVYDLGLICDKLDAIYELMKEQGDIEPVHTDADFAAWFQVALSSETTVRIPDEATDGLSFIAYLLTILQNVGWFAAMGALGLATGVAYWIIFKGRG